jgi:diacylglycerol kinase family enzyme
VTGRGGEYEAATPRPAGPVARRPAADVAVRPTVGERVSAVGALIALVGAVGFSLIGIALHLLAVLVVAAGLLICVTSGWYVVSRRGLRRIAALCVVVLALAGIVVGLFFAHINWPLLLLIAVLAVLSVIAARHALRRTERELRAESAKAKRARRAEQPVLIMNPKSGGGKAERFRLADECRRRGIKPVLLTPGDDLRQLAEDAVSQGADAIGMAGGDGSQALVASVAAQAGLPYVCVPAGTRNHFALDLGLNRDDVVGALDAFADGVEHRIDLATVNGRTFVNNASLGLYAKVVQSPEYRDAKLRTAAEMLPDMLGPEAAPLDLCFTGPDGAEHHTAHLILISNNAYQLVPMEGGVGTRERLDTGLLGIVAVSIGDAAEANAFFALEAFGQGRRYGGWMEWTAPRFEITSAAEVEIGVDGEALQMRPPVVFESKPGALRVRLPRHALRKSPAARTVHVLSRSTITELGRVAAGSGER